MMRVVGAAAVAMLAAAALPAAAAASEQLTYRITHAVFGDIGTYSNTVEPQGGGTKVETRSHITVHVLGATLYHEEAQRTEEWQGNRLVSFHGVTRKSTGPIEIRGAARGNSFVISTPQGTITAPATVHPANPWSANFIGSDTMMRPDSGKIEQVSVSGGTAAPVTINNTTIPARRYEVNGQTRYSVWLDGQGIPIKFVVDDSSGKVTFTLTHCSQCGLDAAAAVGVNRVAAQR